MARAFLRGDLQLLGYGPIVDSDYEVDSPSFSVIKASVQAGLERVQSTFVYVKATCTAADLEKVAAYARARSNSYVVYSRSTLARYRSFARSSVVLLEASRSKTWCGKRSKRLFCRI